MSSIQARAIIPDKFDFNAALDLLSVGVRNEGEIEQRLYQETYRTWRGKPEHKFAFSRTQKEIKASNIIDNKIYFFVHGGTKVRYAVLSRDWISKTTPRLLGSGAGRGRVLFVSKKFPRPGIEAREWTDVIINERRKPFEEDIQRIMKEIANTMNTRGQG